MDMLGSWRHFGAFVCLGGLALGAGCVRDNGKCLSPFQLASPLSASLAFDMVVFVGCKFGIMTCLTERIVCICSENVAQ